MAKIKRYITSEGQILSSLPNSLFLNGTTYIPPSDEDVIANGWTIEYIEPEPITRATNETIRMCRQKAYTNRADKYFIAYQAYVELGENEKAEESKKQWLEEREKIDKQYPYNEEETFTEEVENATTE